MIPCSCCPKPLPRGGQQRTLVSREVYPQCKASKYKKNSHKTPECHIKKVVRALLSTRCPGATAPGRVTWESWRGHRRACMKKAPLILSLLMMVQTTVFAQ